MVHNVGNVEIANLYKSAKLIIYVSKGDSIVGHHIPTKLPVWTWLQTAQWANNLVEILALLKLGLRFCMNLPNWGILFLMFPPQVGIRFCIDLPKHNN